jgi:hypothetical protein
VEEDVVEVESKREEDPELGSDEEEEEEEEEEDERDVLEGKSR